MRKVCAAILSAAICLAVPGSTGNAAWGIVWVAPRGIYPAQ
ncbi:TPA: Ail/Lom family outer membrane beta-barrel protein, partial [Escherichia coli]|nr:Ail/Lom family outer membrane beta-barrel protein [Escherichia coli]